jgi:hypothetical protein
MLSAADRDEPHGECAEVLRTRHSELVIATPVVTETAWMIESRLGPAAEARFLRHVTTGELEVAQPSRCSFRSATQLPEGSPGIVNIGVQGEDGGSALSAAGDVAVLYHLASYGRPA